jgi:hypothetical protein
VLIIYNKALFVPLAAAADALSIGTHCSVKGRSDTPEEERVYAYVAICTPVYSGSRPAWQMHSLQAHLHFPVQLSF